MPAVDSKTFRAAVISPEAQLLDTDVTQVVIPAHDGMVGLLTHRAPLLTRLGVGILRLDLPDGTGSRFLITGGYAQMRDNVLTILTDEALPADQVTPQLRTATAAKMAALTGTDAATATQRQTLHTRLAAIDHFLATR
ncbi:MAG: F0F1 ATP synthase subunit epsilon [Phycisphaerae bacterium]